MRRVVALGAIFLGVCSLTACSAGTAVESLSAPPKPMGATVARSPSPDPCVFDAPCTSADGVEVAIVKVDAGRWKEPVEARGIEVSDPQVVVEMSVANHTANALDVGSLKVSLQAQDRTYAGFTLPGTEPGVDAEITVGERRTLTVTFAGSDGRGAYDGSGVESARLVVKPSDLQPIVFTNVPRADVPPIPPTTTPSTRRASTPITRTPRSNGWDKNGNGVCDRGEELPPQSNFDGRWSDASEHGCQYDADLQDKLDRQNARQYDYRDDDADGIPNISDDTPAGTSGRATQPAGPRTLVRPTPTGACPAGTAFSPRKGRCVTLCEEFPSDPDC